MKFEEQSPLDSFHDRMEALQNENQKLRKKLENLNSTIAQRRKRTKWFAARVSQFAWWLVAGPNLARSIENWLSAAKQGQPFSAEQLAQLAAAVINRLIRVGLIGLILALLPTILLVQQNVLISNQNNLLDLQVHLSESQRRSALIFELTSILEAIEKFRSEMINASSKVASKADSTRSRKGDQKETVSSTSNSIELPSALNGRIIALSRSLRPYRYVEVREGTASMLTDRALSPERGQLLITLLSANVKLSPILGDSDFSNADLPGAVLNGAQLEWIRLNKANLDGAFLREVNLEYAFLMYATLRGAKITAEPGIPGGFGARLSYANLWGADFTSAKLTYVQLFQANLIEAILIQADLRGAILKEADLRNADLRRARLSGAIVDGANFEGADLRGSYVASADWIDKIMAMDKPPKGINHESWEVISLDNHWILRNRRSISRVSLQSLEITRD